jgi:hypothetical protein
MRRHPMGASRSRDVVRRAACASARSARVSAILADRSGASEDTRVIDPREVPA